MSSPFDSLPPEIVQKCVEFLGFDLVSGDLKAVSKATRGVARRALTRGRWKPFRCVAVQGLAVCAAEDRAWPVEGLHGQRGATDPPPAAACAIFREAWALDPALVIRLISDWDTASINHERADAGVYEGRFLWIVERAMDGLSRIISACEDTCTVNGTAYFPCPMLIAWIAAADAGVLHDSLSLEEQGTLAEGWTHEQRLRRLYGSNAIGLLVGKGLEAWANPELAADFMHIVLGNVGMEDFDTPGMKYTVHSWSGDWEDRAKADKFFFEMRAWMHYYGYESDHDY